MSVLATARVLGVANVLKPIHATAPMMTKHKTVDMRLKFVVSGLAAALVDATAAPHLVQNAAVSLSFEPQCLQNNSVTPQFTVAIGKSYKNRHYKLSYLKTRVNG